MPGKRVKPVLQAPAITTLEQADQALADIAAARRELARLELAFKEETAALKQQLAEDAEPHRQRIAALEQALLIFADSGRDKIFGKRKSIALNFGSIGYRAATAVQTLKKSITWARVLQLIKERAVDAVRIKEEVDKDKLRALPADELAAVGCKLVQTDDFFYEVNDENAKTTPAPADA